MDVSELVEKRFHEELAWLGTVPHNWLVNFVAPGISILPVTSWRADPDILKKHKGADRFSELIKSIEYFFLNQNAIVLAYMEAASAFIANGPKLFCPTQEQWDSMEHVEINLPLDQFRMPFPALAIQIPVESRRRLISEYNLTSVNFPTQTLVRFRQYPDQNDFLFIMNKFGSGEYITTMQNRHNDDDIEQCINRTTSYNKFSREITNQKESECSKVIARASLNMCMLLAHYGCNVGAPINPTEYNKHRQKKHLQHLKHNDYLSVEMKQNVVVRKPQFPTQNPPGPGTGIEVAPHWRKGHWRAYPNQGALRAAGQKVPLLFVRPCLVREDRISGNISDSESTYQG